MNSITQKIWLFAVLATVFGIGLFVFAPIFFLLIPLSVPMDVLDNAQPVADEIVAALSAYRKNHGKYPRHLDELVEKAYLKSVPELPSYRGLPPHGGFRYASHQALDFYQLYFSYFVPGGGSWGRLVSHSRFR